MCEVIINGRLIMLRVWYLDICSIKDTTLFVLCSYMHYIFESNCVNLFKSVIVCSQVRATEHGRHDKTSWEKPTWLGSFFTHEKFTLLNFAKKKKNWMGETLKINMFTMHMLCKKNSLLRCDENF